ncbi:unnamed protein product [Lupinus luteus]|uniref:Uncharacterized protein n=1 Tax=Lupinus luteus TaxID=3873 RepID=A0AAV1VYC4_LUPLU
MEIEDADTSSSTSVFEMHGFISNATYTAKKMTMIIFINGQDRMQHRDRGFSARLGQGLDLTSSLDRGFTAKPSQCRSIQDSSTKAKLQPSLILHEIDLK